MSVVVLDCGLGNSGSVVNIIRRVGGAATLTSQANDIESASGIVLPGVGAFDTGVTRLRAAGVIDALNEAVLHRRVPVLGICLGMQMMGQRSEEGVLPGLGWIAARTVPFDIDEKIRLPHMGWNEVRRREGTEFLPEVNGECRFYFLHSYHLACDTEDMAIGWTRYGSEFVSAVQVENITGVQFHPEKSHRFGMALMEAFLRRLL